MQSKDRIALPVFDIEMYVVGNGGWIGSSLISDDDSDEMKASMNAIEAIVLAHACAGVDVKNSAYIEGLRTAVESIVKQIGD